MSPNLSVGRSETTVIHKGDLQVGLSYRYSKRDVLRHGTEEIPNPFSFETISQTANFNLNFGLSNSFSIAASAPVIRLERFADSIKAGESKTATTFGDLSILPRAFFSPRIFGKPANLQLALGASLPTSNGAFNAETNQSDFASGTIDPLVSATLAALVGGGANAFVSIYSRLTLKESGGREAGDLFSARLGITRALSGDDIRGTLRLRWTHIEPDVTKNSLGVSTKVGGGDFYSLSPGLTAKLFGSGESAINGWLEIDIPVSQNVLAKQLTESWSLSLGLTTGLTLFGHDEKPKKGLEHHH